MLTVTLTLLLFSSSFMLTASAAAPSILDPMTIPKYVTQLDGPPPVYVPTLVGVVEQYVVDASEFYQQILPTGYGPTKVWGYGGQAKNAVTGAPLGYIRNSPGPSFEATRGTPVQVKWVNNLAVETDTTNHVYDLNQPLSHMFTVDPTLHWADPTNPTPGTMRMWDTFPTTVPGIFTNTMTNPPTTVNAQTPVPLVTHLHGAETQSYYDGGPEQWFTPTGVHGQDYATYGESTDANAAVYYYPNSQRGATLWYHDHALGITRINVMSGLAGFYLLSDTSDSVESSLPSGKYDMPLVFQDRNFLADGSFYFPDGSDTAGPSPTNPDVHPYWIPEFFGNVSMVNGKAWPNMNVDHAAYRFRLLDGSNARFYNINFTVVASSNPALINTLIPFTQIATDGGFLKQSVPLTSLLIAPGERAEILVDFTGIPTDTTIRILNDANGPYPDGDPVNPDTMGQIMQFTVTGNTGDPAPSLPSQLNPTLLGAFPNLPAATNTRVLTLTEIMGPGGPLEVLLDGQKWIAPTSEKPVLGTTEEWVIFNPTADAHPIHLHLIQFQLVQRQVFDPTYFGAWKTANGRVPNLDLAEALTVPTINVADPSIYMTGTITDPTLNEQGWKDTIQMNPGEVTTIRVRFTAQDGSAFPFDATAGQGYVWHCHIIDHEDNEMMRPYKVVPVGFVIPESALGTLGILVSTGVALLVFLGVKRLRFKADE